MSWPPNPYLDAFLRSPDGQSLLAKHGCLDNWRRRHMLDDIPVVADDSMPPDTFMLVAQPRPQETLEDTAKRSVLVTNVNLADAWDF